MFIRKILQNPIWISILVLLSIISIFIFASWVLYNHTVNILTDNLRERLLSISITAAANIDAKDLDALQVEADWQKPEWGRVINPLHRAKYSNKDIVFMYVFRYTKDPNDDPKNMEFVGDADSIDPYANTNNDPSGQTLSASACSKCIDSNRDGKIEPDGPDKLQWPGQPFPEANDIPEAYEVYNTGKPTTVKDIYTDDYGSVLTGFAPIKDENGNTVAILGTDIKADDFFTTTRQTLYPFFTFGLSLVLVIIIFNILLIRSIRKEVQQREEIGRLADRLKIALGTEKKAKEELEKLDKLKDQFLSQVQHDLRTPLTAIMGYSDLLNSGAYGKITKKIGDVVKKIDDVALNMKKKADSFLDLAQFKLGKGVALKSGVALAPMIKEIVEELQFKAGEKKVKVQFGATEDANLSADREKLKAAIFNIIDNAVKYTPAGTVEVGLTKADGKAKIRVKDNGIGIPQDKLSAIFEEQFQRTEQAKKTAEGKGVGLYLSSQIIKLHGGKIWAESAGEGKGSIFYIELPL